MAFNVKTTSPITPDDRSAWSPAPKLGVEVSVSPLIEKTAPESAPLIALVGTNSLSAPCTDAVYRWRHESPRALSGSIGSTMNNTDTTSTVTYTADNLLVNDVIRFSDGELCAVTASDAGANTITLLRGFAGSAKASHTSGSSFILIGRAAIVGADAPGDSYMIEPGQEYNYVQKIDLEKYISDLWEITERGKRLSAHLKDAYTELNILYERILLYGLRAEGSSTSRPAAGGLEQFVYNSGLSSCTVDSLNMPFDYDMVVQDMRAVVDQVGTPPDVLLVGSYQAAKIAAMQRSIATVTAGQGDTRAGVRVIKLETQFGTVDVVYDRHVLPDRAYYLSTSKLGFGPVKGGEMKVVTLGKSGDSQKLYFYGYYTCEVRNPGAHRIRYDLYYE